jgi:hypothetical protein
MVVYNGIRCIEGILFIKPRIKFANNEEEYKKLLENQAYIDAMKARKFGINCNDALVDDAVSREITREDILKLIEYLGSTRHWLLSIFMILQLILKIYRTL